MTTPGTMSIYPATFGATFFEQLRAYDITPEMNRTEVISAGTVDRVAVIESHSDPRYRFETNDLLKVLQTVSIVTGWCPTAATFQAQRRLHCGTFMGAGNHYTFSNPGGGFVHIERLSWRQDDPEGGQASMIFVPFYDGVNFPIKLAQDQNLTGTAQFNSHYYGGHCTMNVAGALQTFGLMGLEIEPTIEFQTKRSDGDVYPRTGSINSRRPIIRATFVGHEALRTDVSDRRPGFAFNALSGDGNLDFFMYQGVHGGRRHPLANQKHIRIRIGGNEAWNISRISGRDSQDVEVTWEILPSNNNWSILVDSKADGTEP